MEETEEKCPPLCAMAVIMVLNTLINQTGSTVLFREPLLYLWARSLALGHNLCSGDGNPLADRLYRFYAF